ncbi:hypothetical protein K7X08_013562 [Anisodus acutangulus]|uniref:Transmembrane protein n=1 Tax=Anisodus acutangulus TaxID=402998 RepID=A0A9Q1LKC6_9SOLA|nr:hypothetical protein K7X08_013562 [Anisodus acutangulus]
MRVTNSTAAFLVLKFNLYSFVTLAFFISSGAVLWCLSNSNSSGHLDFTKKKDVGTEAGEVSDVPSSSVSSTAAAVAGKQASVPVHVQPAVVHQPIPEYQQRELLKSILEEKTKLKPKDSEEKRRIDEEKALLKQFIRAKSIPSL